MCRVSTESAIREQNLKHTAQVGPATFGTGKLDCIFCWIVLGAFPDYSFHRLFEIKNHCPASGSNNWQKGFSVFRVGAHIGCRFERNIQMHVTWMIRSFFAAWPHWFENRLIPNLPNRVLFLLSFKSIMVQGVNKTINIIVIRWIDTVVFLRIFRIKQRFSELGIVSRPSTI